MDGEWYGRVQGECGGVFDGWRVVENQAKRVEEGGVAVMFSRHQNGVFGVFCFLGCVWTNFCDKMMNMGDCSLAKGCKHVFIGPKNLRKSGQVKDEMHGICVCGVQWSKGENEVMMQSVKGKMEWS